MRSGFVYIIQSKKNNRYYIGASFDPLKRIGEHNNGRTPSTQHGRPWILKFQKEFSTIQEAKTIEYRLKSMKSRILIEKIIKEKAIKLHVR